MERDAWRIELTQAPLSLRVDVVEIYGGKELIDVCAQARLMPGAGFRQDDCGGSVVHGHQANGDAKDGETLPAIGLRLSTGLLWLAPFLAWLAAVQGALRQIEAASKSEGDAIIQVTWTGTPHVRKWQNDNTPLPAVLDTSKHFGFQAFGHYDALVARWSAKWADGNSTILNDQPETPAHIFAARAFAYRLWGTPKPPSAAKQTSGDAKSLRRAASVTAQVSPTRPSGILMTPGTANLRRAKTVTFGERPRNVEAAILPLGTDPVIDAVPGQFPSPSKLDIAAMQSVQTVPVQRTAVSGVPKAVGSSKTAQTQTTTTPTASAKPLAVTDQHCDWKMKLEQYSDRTEREMRKLIAKQRAAKHYARDQDVRSCELTELLRKEHDKVLKLEQQVKHLNAQVADLQGQILLSTTLEPVIKHDDLRQDAPARMAAGRATQRMEPVQQCKPPRHIDTAAMEQMNPRDAIVKPLPLSRSIQADVDPLRPRDINIMQSHTPSRTPPTRADILVTPTRSSARRPAREIMHQTTQHAELAQQARRTSRSEKTDAELTEETALKAKQTKTARHSRSQLYESQAERSRAMHQHLADAGQTAMSIPKLSRRDRSDDPIQTDANIRREKAMARIAARRLERQKGTRSMQV